eukprot:CAMPEP_0194742558 /NCGR_PEP_ID=MMETSP0296-20130528/99824_1 /TAXON_ID=39354 /ORGANISM="Heterosigma akashiwo, Strain CCMP2393" /LENGTH=103 /DNA_ID=CAMNT_0039654493 /DNA_START=1944 /DNA_END=2256 /DNA_ORIENTATION=-
MSSCPLALQSGVGISDPDAELLSAGDDVLTLLGGHVVGDLRAVLPVVHHEKLKLSHVVHQELEEPIGKHVAGLLVGPVADLGHGDGALEATSDAGVNTLWLSP